MVVIFGDRGSKY